MSKTIVTKEIVEKVKSYLDKDKYGNLTHDEIALLCGTSATSVSRISNGQYDHLLKPVEKITQSNTDDVNVAIDYETLKHLMACEYAVKAILDNSKLSTGYDGALFIDYKVVYGILKAYLPDDTNRKLEELKREEAN